MPVPYTRGLHEVAPHTWAWLAPDGGWGLSNSGLVAGTNEALLVDTLYDLGLTRELLDALSPITSSRPITRAVNTHGNGDHCFGNVLLPGASTVHARPGVAHRLHAESPQLMAGLAHAELGPVLGPYVREAFGAYSFDGIELRDPDVDVVETTSVDVGGTEVVLLPVPPAHTEADLAVHVPDRGVLFTGDLLFVGGTPLMWAGPADSWIAALDGLIALDPQVVVPGHGPVTDVDGIREVQAYLRHVHDRAVEAWSAGVGWEQAAREIDLDRFATLNEAERVAANMYAAYRALDPATPQVAMLGLFTAMAEWKRARG